MNIRVKVNVKGLVQGVNFRWYTKMTAESLGVHGWVRNLPDSSVEGCFEGEATAVRQLIEWCRKGPSHARVDDLILQEEAYVGEFIEFDIQR